MKGKAEAPGKRGLKSEAEAPDKRELKGKAKVRIPKRESRNEWACLCEDALVYALTRDVFSV